MQYLRPLFLVFFFAVGALSLPGCKYGPELPADLPELTPCKLSLVQDGQPLAGASVTLIAKDQSLAWFPGGVTDDKGNVELYTTGKYKGAPTGTYKVTVTKTEQDPSNLGPPPDGSDPQYDAWLEKSSREKRNTYSFVEKRFTDAKTSPLEITIPGGETTLDVGKSVKEKL